MNYCPVCKREYKQLNRNQTGRCPVCGSKLMLISDDDLERVRRSSEINTD